MYKFLHVSAPGHPHQWTQNTKVCKCQHTILVLWY